MKKSQRRDLKHCEKKLSQAENYADWLQTAKQYDTLLGRDSWRCEEASPFYPYEVLQEQIDLIQGYRLDNRADLLIPYLQESLHRTLGELTDPHLYDMSLVGTKHLVDRYLDEIEATLNYLCDTDVDFLDRPQKLKLFKQARQNFGRTALMLSGGGAFGIYHFGVIQTLLEHGLLPDVISGTSMGAIVAGFVGTHTDEEILEKLAVPENNHFIPLSWFRPDDMIRQGSMFDHKQLIECIQANIPNETFLEAYQRTGRVISITVSPTRAGQKARVLDYKTAPNVLVPYACKASCSIPAAFPPVQLMAKNAKGSMEPYMESELWADGGVSLDIPMGRMGRLHNVNHFIVSQTNPHVLPFVSNRNRAGVLPFLLDFATSSIHAQWHQAISVSKKRISNRQTRFWLDRADAILGQDYLGHINLHPDFPLHRYLKVMSNPSNNEILNYILAGQKATWPKLAMIKNQTRISRVLRNCTHRLKQQD